MKKLTTGLLAVAAMISVQSINAQTVDEVIDKYEIALGGKEKLMSLKTVKMTGSINVQGLDVGVTVTVVHGIGSRNDIFVPGMGEGFQVMNASKGWNFMPFEGQAGPEEVSDEQQKSAQVQLDLQGTLVNYKEKGSRVELLGKETVDGAECYKLKLTGKQGEIGISFIDAKTWYRVKSITKTKTSDGEVEASTIYADFKKNEEGYIFPFSQTIDRGTIIFSTIETNKPVDEKIFTVK